MTAAAIYQEGALSVRTVADDSPRLGFAVYFDHGSVRNPGRPTIVPPRTQATRHPLYVGQEHKSGDARFRTKAGARRYMEAVHEVGVLPEDRPAARAEVRALRNWIEKEGARRPSAS